MKPYQNLSLQDIEGERWRSIEGFEDYMISNMGRVKSLPRKIRVNREEGYYINKKLRILKQNFTSTTGATLILHKKNKGHGFLVSTIVGKAFFDNFTFKKLSGFRLYHINEDPYDNRVENLRISRKKKEYLHKLKEIKKIIKKFDKEVKKERLLEKDGYKKGFKDGQIDSLLNFLTYFT